MKAKLVIADKELHSETVAKPANIDKLIYLKGIIKATGDTQRQLCKQMGICIGSLNAKLNGKGEFKQGEIVFLKERYHLTDKQVEEIFL